MQMYWRKILSEYPYTVYKNSFIFRLKTTLKIVLKKNKKSSPILYTKYKYIFYIKDIGHLSRALEFKESILNKIEIVDILIILNTNNKHTKNLVYANFTNIITFSVDINTLEYLKLLYYLCLFIFKNKIKYLILALKIYEKGLFKYFQNYSNSINNNKLQLISFNDQPIDISLLLYTFKKNHLITESIVYQHGIIALPQFYFPSKSDKFYAYAKEEKVIDYFNQHNRYNSEFVAVGNLKYQKAYQKIVSKDKKDAALIILTPSWKNFFKTIQIIEKKERAEYKFYLRLHPGMKCKRIAKFITKKVGLFIDENTKILFSPFDIVITEVSTVGFEALAEGYPIAILIDLNYDLQYYFKSKYLPKIKKINILELENAKKLCHTNKDKLDIVLKKFFG